MTGATAQQKATGSGGINPWQRQEFLSLYPNRDRHIYKQKADSNWKVSRFRLATGLIDAAISAECKTFYGSFWGEQTSFAVLDIDSGSNYQNTQELKQLRQRLASIGLSGTLLVQSSDSGGWHLYVPFEDPATSKEVEQALKAWLKGQGYDIRGGQVEVFPSGNGLRLPLQSGFAWLDENGTVIVRREDLSQEQALSRFLNDFRTNLNDWMFAKTLIDSQLALAAAVAARDAQAHQAHQDRLEIGGFEHLFSAGRITEHWEKGRKFWQEGLTAAGQRHDAVLYVGHYLWYGDSENGIAALPGTRNDEYRARLIEEWLTKKHNGFCRHIDQNKWEEIKAQIKRAVLWRGNGQAKEYEPYRLTDRLLKRLLAIFRKTGKVWTVENFKQANDDRQEEARCKIRAAVAQCLEEGRQISRSTLQMLTGCSPNTLKKHADLWKLFALGSGEYNRGGAGGLAALGNLSLVLRSQSSREKKEISYSECSVLEIEISENLDSATGPDLLRYASSRADGEELKARESDQSCAVNPNQSNFGVKPGLTAPRKAAPPAVSFYRGTSSESKAMTRGDSLTELSTLGTSVHQIIELLLKLGRSAVAEPVHQDAPDSSNSKAVVFNILFDCLQSHFEHSQPVFQAGSLLDGFSQQGIDRVGLNAAIQPIKPIFDVLVGVKRDLDFVVRHQGTSSLLAYASKHQQYRTSQCSTPSEKRLDASSRRTPKRGVVWRQLHSQKGGILKRTEGATKNSLVPSVISKGQFSLIVDFEEISQLKTPSGNCFGDSGAVFLSGGGGNRAPPC